MVGNGVFGQLGNFRDEYFKISGSGYYGGVTLRKEAEYEKQERDNK